jgi:hypothetical protein
MTEPLVLLLPDELISAVRLEAIRRSLDLGELIAELLAGELPVALADAAAKALGRPMTTATSPAQEQGDPRPEPEVVSESVPHTSTLPVIVPPSSDTRSDRRASAS